DIQTPQQQGEIPSTSGSESAAAVDRASELATNDRVAIDTPSLHGSINLVGARFDDLRLKHYRETVDPDSPEIELLNPATLESGYFAEIGFVGNEATGPVPGPETVWSVEGPAKLTPSSPVTLTYDNGQGLIFKRAIAVDDDYMFTVSDAIENSGSTPVTLSNYGRVTRFGLPPSEATYVLHEGLIGVTGTEGLQEHDYSAVRDDKQYTPGKSTDGWLGMTDKYWAVAVVP